jgi:hypothetical protein
MLHITNGDSAAGTLRQAGVPGDVLAWRDVLHEGPVPERLTNDELRVVRARFIADSGWGAFEDTLEGFTRRDKCLADSLAHEEVVLWFEHDLYDQLQLLQLLDWFAGRDLGTTRLSMICNAEYLGAATADRLRELFPDRRPVSATEQDLGRKAWTAFRSSNPSALTDLLGQDTSTLPFLRGALLRHLQQFPSARNGLSRSESQALEVVAGGVTKLAKIYVASHHEREESIFLGDCIFATYMEELSRGAEPLIMREDGKTLVAPRKPAVDFADFWGSEVKLTDSGRAVLEAKKDRVKVNGINRWLGGVHLQDTDRCWRWNQAAGRLQTAAA